MDIGAINIPPNRGLINPVIDTPRTVRASTTQINLISRLLTLSRLTIHIFLKIEKYLLRIVHLNRSQMVPDLFDKIASIRNSSKLRKDLGKLIS